MPTGAAGRLDAKRTGAREACAQQCEPPGEQLTDRRNRHSPAGVGLPVLAAAQPPPPPPPGGGGYAAAEPAEPKMRFDVGLFAALPQGDLDGDGSQINTSPGINLQFGYTVMPNLGLSVGLRYIAIQVDGGTDGVDFSNYDFDIGGRYSFPVSPTAKLFGEAMLIFSTLAVDNGTQSESESGIGFLGRVGGAFKVSGNISVGGSLSFSTATIEIQGTDIDTAWAALEGFVSFGF
jgi:Outer membrane protein beta-barrel domain